MGDWLAAALALQGVTTVWKLQRVLELTVVTNTESSESYLYLQMGIIIIKIEKRKKKFKEEKQQKAETNWLKKEKWQQYNIN